MKKLLLIGLFPMVVSAATFQFNFGAGFNDATPVTPVGGNSGTTLGQQRQILFQAVANIWGARIQSNVTIVVNASFTSLFCQPNSVVLGSAGPAQLHSNFPSAPIPNTFYPRALVDAIRGVDNNPGAPDIITNFNSNVDTGCFNGGTFYYGINGDAPGNKVQLFSTVLHELGHGLGFVSLTDGDDASFPFNMPAIFDRFIFDTQSNMPWTAMTDPQRFSSMTNDPFLVWNGNNVTNNAANYISQGYNSGLVRLHAPGSLQPGSSISHFSTTASPDLLLESSIGNLNFNQIDLTPYLFQDMGYIINSDLIFADSFE
ncbi:hypothetical protein MNBD_GAMMA01-9 [hydrothermal vent metagenome]|uniref:Uncharacterized protein n=1 Tax=hydrothermal vent metagenome TaxID=652676 RepID=A0A3B0W7T2_9ZZZZ